MMIGPNLDCSLPLLLSTITVPYHNCFHDDWSQLGLLPTITASMMIGPNWDCSLPLLLPTLLLPTMTAPHVTEFYFLISNQAILDFPFPDDNSQTI